MEVALFITCLTETFYPRAGIAVVKVLERLGCKVEFPEGQTCCGQPMYNNGFPDEARELARRMVRGFEGARYVVAPSASCAAMVREHYPELLGDDPAYARGARELAGKTYEFAEFLVKVLQVDLAALGAKWPGHATYHYSCHQRGLGIAPPLQTMGAANTGDTLAVRLLRQIDGLRFTPLEKADQCCGFGGTFALKYPPISGLLARDKVACIRATGASIVVSSDAGCTMNLAGTCHREGVAVEFKHIAEVIAESLGLLPVEVGGEHE
jgi:L-lactate dehydrogenase complex protein LldE